MPHVTLGATTSGSGVDAESRVPADLVRQRPCPHTARREWLPSFDMALEGEAQRLQRHIQRVVAHAEIMWLLQARAVRKALAMSADSPQDVREQPSPPNMHQRCLRRSRAV